MKALDKWVIARRIAPRDKKGKFISRESVNFFCSRMELKKFEIVLHITTNWVWKLLKNFIFQI